MARVVLMLIRLSFLDNVMAVELVAGGTPAKRFHTLELSIQVLQHMNEFVGD